ncbi:surface lipoprotein assembly modifier [Geminicoccus harenae]|uniref:surface lipoprotein assembly modifier n=1 Tax=Geminicoccus harenae TaxID=2498453 RepID=UPI00168A6E34|nr:surface lipoprotein assembly modifier [Geminicoccus harenae]
MLTSMLGPVAVPASADEPLIRVADLPRLSAEAIPGEGETPPPDNEEDSDDARGADDEDSAEEEEDDDAPDDSDDEGTGPNETAGNSRHHIEAAISFGLSYETNPDNVAKLGGRSRLPGGGQPDNDDDDDDDDEDDDGDDDDDDEEARESDFSATFGLDLTHRYDLYTAIPSQLRTDLSLEGARYADQTDNDYTSFDLIFGPEFQLDEAREASLRPFLAGALLGLGGELLSRSAGAGLEGDLLLAPKLNLSASFSSLYEEYEDTEDEPSGSDQTGWFHALSLDADYALAENTTLTIGLIGNFKHATEGFEQYYELGFGIGVEHSLSNPLDEELDPVTLGFEAGYIYRPYDDPDPDADVDKAETDRQFDADLVAIVPFRPRWSAVLRLFYTDNQSNYPDEEYENFGILVGVSYDFDSDDD